MNKKELEITINPDGSADAQLNADGLGPAWSPDGNQILFARYLGSNDGRIWRMHADGTGETIIFHADALNGIDWQSIPEPNRSDYKNSNQFCKAEQAFWGDQFSQHYRNFGQCVSGR